MLIRIETVEISDSWLRKCSIFAVECAESNWEHYQKRGKLSKEKLIQDIYTGKLGEVGAYLFLKHHFIDITKPDLKVYDRYRKSFNADLCVPDLHFHVKCQRAESITRFGVSWLLQYSGNGAGHTDKLFRRVRKSDYLVLTSIDSNIVSIYGVVSVDKIFSSNMLELPKNPWLQTTKRALYWDTLKELNHYWRWGVLPSKI